MGMARVMKLRCWLALWVCQAAALASPPPAGLTVTVSILDHSHQPVAGVRVQLKATQGVVTSSETDQKGHAEFTQLVAGRYEITATKEGLEPVTRELDLSNGEPASIELTAIPSLTRRETIDVRGTVAPIEQEASMAKELAARTAKELPGRPATVADALPLI